MVDQRSKQTLDNTPRSSPKIVEVLVDLFSWFANSWIRPLKGDPLIHWKRFAYAFVGSCAWLLVNLKSDHLEIFSKVSSDQVALGNITLIIQIGLGAWFAWLISYQKRSCSPSRFFLEGLLLPGVAAVLVRGSFLSRLFGLDGTP